MQYVFIVLALLWFHDDLGKIDYGAIVNTLQTDVTFQKVIEPPVVFKQQWFSFLVGILVYSKRDRPVVMPYAIKTKLRSTFARMGGVDLGIVGTLLKSGYKAFPYWEGFISFMY